MTREAAIAATFVELADTLVDEFDALDFLHTLTESSCQLLAADAAGLIISDQRGGLQVVASTSHRAALLELFQLQSAQGPCLESFTTGGPVVNVDIEDQATRWPDFAAAATSAGFLSTHALPLRLGGECIGAMNLFSAERSTLSDIDVALAQALADVATIGLLQERAVQQRSLLAEQLQTALNRRLLIEQAKGALAERAGVSPDRAFEMIRTHSRRTGQSMTTAAAAALAGTLSPEDLEAAD